jgi:hypothetical protein
MFVFRGVEYLQKIKIMVIYMKKSKNRIVVYGYASFVILLLVVVMLYIWHWQLGSARHLWRTQWAYNHSEFARYNEIKKFIKQGNWNHDLCIMFANHYADKDLVSWLINDLRPTDTMGCLSRKSHRGSLLSRAANIDMGDKAVDWIGWWDANKEKTQIDWIIDGFKRAGIEVKEKGEMDEAVALSLLRLIGSEDSPSYLSYNAYRFLNAKHINPYKLFIDKVDSDKQIKTGLIRYSSYMMTYPDAGAILFNYYDEDLWYGESRPLYVQERTEVYVIIALSLLTVLGCFFVIMFIYHLGKFHKCENN